MTDKRALVKRDNFELSRFVSKVDYITEDEFLDLLRVSKHPEHILLFKLLWQTGMRISEALSLERNNIRQDEIFIVGKGGKPRRIPVQAKLLVDLLTYYESHGNNRIFQKITTEPGALYMMRRYARDAGITKRIHPHLFRHSFAINFMRQTGQPFALQNILGHASMDMVKVYMRLASTDTDEAISKMRFE